MRPLKDVLAALHRELEAGLPAGARWEADRVVLTLEVVARVAVGQAGAEGISWQVPTTAGAGESAAPVAGEGGRLSTLRVEFKPPGPGAAPASVPVAGAWGAVRPTGPETSAAGLAPQRRVELLTGVFGAPGGFYSHNRAEVFLGVVEELSAEGYATLLAGLAGAPDPAGDPAVALARGQLANLLRSGPAGSVERGAARLREAVEGLGRAELTALLRETWRNEGRSSDVSGA